MPTATAEDSRITRRQLLGGAAAVSVGSMSGCMQRIRSILNRDSTSTVSLTVTAPPADSDRMATLIARHLVENFEDVGINATLNILPETELYRDVLLNRNFDLFVARMPPMDDPQALYSLMHSVFASEPGWQNPYGFSDITVDDHLERQRSSTGENRQEAVADLLGYVLREQPFTPIAFPDEIRAARTDNFVGWESYRLQDPLSYLALERAEGVPASEELTLRLAIADSRPSQNLNPISVEHRKVNPLTDLIYDPLVRQIEDEFIPWLAADYSWEADGENSRFTVSLRPGLVWHDDTSITADDVVFTYRFLDDTSFGEVGHSIPAPLFRSRSSLVTDVHAVDDSTAEITFEDVSEEVAVRALTVPLFPEHIWREETEVADIQGIEGSDNVTEAIVTSNTSAVGSGPLEVENVSSDDSIVLEPFADHFLRHSQGRLERIPDRFSGEPAFDAVEFEVVPSNETAVELVAQGELDGTATSVDPRQPVIERIIGASGVSRFTEQSASPYHIGYNTGTEPFSNPHFRRLVARLVDKEHITDVIFEGYGRPAANPFDGSRWSPEALDFESVDPEVPFIGTNGEVDVQSARDTFRDHGFEFDENDTLIFR